MQAGVDKSMIVRLMIQVRSNLLFRFTEHTFPTLLMSLFQSCLTAPRPRRSLKSRELAAEEGDTPVERPRPKRRAPGRHRAAAGGAGPQISSEHLSLRTCCSEEPSFGSFLRSQGRGWERVINGPLKTRVGRTRHVTA